ncbi:hypothetical protein SAMN05192529_102219 [Arachidicoccus rhizosphaerae]|uniref:Uncharacterized protein n=1 Tax=Arachidicoccus rhizosphaerae TaxID=551991 RepID=A0A1H3WAP2_9BACT|nr:hypothetical protein [Arachidicoccus rhizosphaerae]SDZ83338.1 hypothetical protein SAMN05192529_102219 [Arachidicoccus rhizosphaerae]
MADPKKISPSASNKELEKWLQEQLDAAMDSGQGAQGDQETRAEDPFFKDAIEGLNKFQGAREVYRQTHRINKALTSKTGSRRHKKSLETNHLFWFIVAIIIIISVIIMAFVVLRMRMGQI